MAEEVMLTETTDANQLRKCQEANAGQEEASLRDSEVKQGLPHQEEASCIPRNDSNIASSTSESRHQNVRNDGLSYFGGFNAASQIGDPYFFAAHSSYPLDPGCLLPSMSPVFYPAFPSGLASVPSHNQHVQHGGLFAVPFYPYTTGPVPFFSPEGLVPLFHNAPLGVAAMAEQHASVANVQAPNAVAREEVIAPEAPEFGAQEGLRRRHVGAAAPLAQGHGDHPQRQVVRRLRVGVQLDLLLILKLVAVVFFFSQDGSKDRLLLLSFLVGLLYIYQTGALTPALRWISSKAQRLMMPPQQVHHAPDQVQHAGNVLANERNTGDNAFEDGMGNEHINAPPNEGAAVPGAAIPAPVEQHPAQGLTWWTILREIQILVLGFVSSLFPGFQNAE